MIANLGAIRDRQATRRAYHDKLLETLTTGVGRMTALASIDPVVADIDTLLAIIDGELDALNHDNKMLVEEMGVQDRELRKREDEISELERKLDTTDALLRNRIRQVLRIARRYRNAYLKLVTEHF